MLVKGPDLELSTAQRDTFRVSALLKQGEYAIPAFYPPALSLPPCQPPAPLPPQRL